MIIADKLQTPLIFITAGLLVFNMTQRRHIKHGQKKRFASLYLAGVILLMYLFAALIERFFLNDYFLLPAAGILITAVILKRKVFFPHQLHCASCGKRLSIKQILYYDDPLCINCSNTQGNHYQHVDSFDWESWKPTEKAVLCFVIDDNRILLINKKTGLGAGKINGPGGRIEPGETPCEAAIRETTEETGITPISPVQRADLSFVFTNGYSLYGSVFITKKWRGTLTETDEADPFWCSVDEMPWDQMWEDDPLWLPEVLSGKYASGRFIFDEDVMLSHQIEFSDPKE
jgi:8-oxo-dGTP diphosphatase